MPTPTQTRAHPRFKTVFPKGTKKRTQQQFKDECDINQIMAKYQKTGALTHVAANAPHYGFADSIDFNAAMQTITRAEQMFADLPSSLRKRFGHDPAAYLDFVSDEANRPEMAELGLLSDEAVEQMYDADNAPEPVSDPPPEPLPGDPE